MSTTVIATETVEVAARPWTETLHEWVTTVDHKRLAILYILYGLGFLVIAGIEALLFASNSCTRTAILFRRKCSIGCSRCTEPRGFSSWLCRFSSGLRITLYR